MNSDDTAITNASSSTAAPDSTAPAAPSTSRPVAGPAAVSSAPPAVEARESDAGRRRGNATRTLAIAALVVALLAALSAAFFWQRSERVAREAARRLQEGDIRIAQLDQMVKQSQDQVRDLLGRSAVFENRLAEAVGQQAQLERLYKDIAQDSVDSVLADVENALSIASQQLLVAGNVQGALAALQDAESRLKRADQPAVLGVRRLVARDIERLRAVPVTDITALTLRLDSVASSIDQLPLVASLAAPPAQSAPAAESQPAGGAIGRIADSSLRGWQALVAELRGLFRVNRLDSPDAMLLAPEQQYFVRENLRLTLLSARIAALSRNDTLFHADLDRSIRLLNTYYDGEQRAVAASVATLRQLQANRIAVELPSLSESLGAARAARVSRDGRS